MSWDDAEKKLKTHFEETKKARMDGKRVPWFSKEFGSFKEMAKTFSSDSENSEYIELLRSDAPDLNKLMGLDHKISFLGQGRAAVRRQHLAGASNVRARRDMLRFGATQALHQEKILKRLKTRVTQERTQKTIG